MQLKLKKENKEISKHKTGSSIIKMKIALFLKSIIAAFAMILGTSEFVAAAVVDKRPNIVLIFADDLGYGDVGYHGSPDMVTPNIDLIASNGVRFSAGYVCAPVCGPSRAGLRTGCYQQRFGAEDNPGPYKRSKDVKIGVPTSMQTISERLKALGYTTCMIGKSHTGNAPEFHPNSSGFDEFFGFINGASNYRSDGRFGKKINQKENPILRNREPVEESEYLTDAFGREAVAFINRQTSTNLTKRANPFFLYVPFNAIHGPMQAADPDLEMFKGIKNDKRRLVVAMNYALDRNVGRIMAALRAHNLEDNTFVIFFSDNGGKPKGNGSLNTPLRGIKGQLWDGGIRIPFCMQWPAEIKPGKKIDVPIISLDILPTVVAAAGGKLQKDDKVDGINLLPLMEGKTNSLPERYLYWRFNRAWAIRDANWKLIKDRSSKRPQLFNISSDISETRDMHAEKPKIVNRLQNKYNEWNSELMPKQWGWDKSFPVYDPEMGSCKKK